MIKAILLKTIDIWHLMTHKNNIPIIRRPKSSYDNYGKRYCDNIANIKFQWLKADKKLPKKNMHKKQQGSQSNRGVRTPSINITETEQKFI